ncbi:sensor histidine kinase [Azospirillum halopraeferens]|uniref:sensor histidine kinase n=1 Tax=Azospirillum halopraeferens TaxID=34010 RepID=UPI0003F693CB|nr:HAMP domain-containing sensor histidine kinase [Azospirillum halopraeferens]
MSGAGPPSDEPEAVRGTVLICDRDGRITASRAVGGGLPGLPDRPDAPFPVLFGPDPFGRSLELFAALLRDGRIDDRVLEVTLRGCARLVYVSGRTQGRSVLVALAARPACAVRLFEDLNRDRPPSALPAPPAAAVRPMPSMETLFGEMASLNSQLATAQRELAKANAELAASNEQKARLLGMLAHDLRTPLQVIAGFARMVSERWEGRAEERDLMALDRIRESSLFMRHLIEDVLSLSALRAGRLTLTCRPVDAGDLVRRNVAMNTILAQGRDVAIDCRIADALPPVSIDPPRIEQVMNNLLSNAAKHSPSGGRITVTVDAAGAGVRIAVADQGPGIPAAELEGLFHPFARTSVKALAGDSSVGLGLFICRSIVEAHGGTIAVDSAPGRGSTFTIDLPAAGPPGGTD